MNIGPKKLYRAIALIILVFFSYLIIWNLDVVLRLFQSYKNGTLTEEKVRFDLASFDLGRRSSVIPIDQKRSAIDGMEQMYIPKGEFAMGIVHESKVVSSPQHIVYLNAFWMDRVEVTNAMYLKCMRATGCAAPAAHNTYYNNWIYRDHPIVYITWDQASIYCLWAGRRLPTEAEWEKAARGTDGRMYPWGNEAPSPRLANFSSALIGESVSSYRYPLGASPYGVLNMSGNVREWVADWYDPDYYSYSPYANPQGPENGQERSLRSTSYNEDEHEIFVTNRLRHEPQSPGLSRGFRCAQDAEAGK